MDRRLQRVMMKYVCRFRNVANFELSDSLLNIRPVEII